MLGRESLWRWSHLQSGILGLADNGRYRRGREGQQASVLPVCGLTLTLTFYDTAATQCAVHIPQHFRGLLVILTLSVTDFSDSTFVAFLLL